MTNPTRNTKDLESPPENRTPQWGTTPSTKTRNAVQRSVTALLDALAPERLVKRIDTDPGPVQQHRTPSGCVLQAAECAVSVSWFPAATDGSELGELHILVWSGKVARRGAPRNVKNAKLVTELVLRPIDPPVDDFLWREKAGDRYNTPTLATHVLSMLETEIRNTTA